MNVLNRKITKVANNKLEAAIIYYKILFAVNNKHLSEMEVNMLGFLSVYGSITSPPNRERFINLFKSTQGSINTVISNMYIKGFVEKRNGKNIISEHLRIDFNNPVVFNITLASKDVLGGENE